MPITAILLGILAAGAVVAQQEPPPVPSLKESGFKPIFDGKSLSGWDCDPDFWRAENGEIIGETSASHQPKQNTFCIWKNGSPADFELKLEYKLTGETGNSGIQYRSVELPRVDKWVMKGYQADIDGMQQFTGQVYEERGRGFVALRGQVVSIPDGGKPGSIGSTGSDAELKALIKNNDWNQLHVIARGNTLIQILNGRVMSVVVDDDKANRKMEGEIGIQLHVTKVMMRIEVRNVRLKLY